MMNLKLTLTFFLISFGAYSTTFVPLTIKEQIHSSEAIAYGEVIELNTYSEDNFIFTVATLELNTWSGINVDNNLIKVHFPGGEFGGRVKIVEGAPKVRIGERVVFMLKKHEGKLWVSNLGLGKFSVKRVGDNNIMINQVFPGRPEVGQVSLKRFFSLTEQIKNEKLQLRFKDKYEIEHEKKVKSYLKNNSRSIASSQSFSEDESESKLPAYWLVILFGVIGITFQVVRNRSS